MEIEALVVRKGGKTRRGKGFSREELKKVGLDFRSALRLGIRIDKRRKTVHDENVRLLEDYLHEFGLKKRQTGRKPNKVEENSKD